MNRHDNRNLSGSKLTQTSKIRFLGADSDRHRTAISSLLFGFA